jgi:DNA replication and repair protein RecF
VKAHGSDGQQRSVALALKLAQIELIETERGRKPVVLLDDILGELDDERKQRFWNCFDQGCQVFASGTRLPERQSGRDWNVIQVEAGGFSPLD